MRPAGTALRLTLLLGEDDRHRHHPLHREVVRRARAAGLPGVTVLRGDEGYGRHWQVHTTRLVDRAERLPVVVIVVGEPAAIRAFRGEGAALLDEVDCIRYSRGRRR
ncbi:DUF190 domain-containing protein [Saccharopolyspora sp. HNM0983]|uniref:DUF190 domain-containing protein n=1 Tax=Saccharopolyspora montiporae TaxID=2781240 RepID=A0A929B9Y5_9PSEU|nr:DUF190 domain-containing protein [Saccharopolyspora sp. HNM0983]MBE9373722.1 DUF190 domain-containing protein [Saccharopolyspora sp. HNM0983]